MFAFKLPFISTTFAIIKFVNSIPIHKSPRQSYKTSAAMSGFIENDSTKIVINPADGSHSATCILMHGLGDSGEGWLDAAQAIAKSMPYTKFILPTAQQIPVTLNGGMRMSAWYDITGLTPDRAQEGCEYIEGSVTRIKQLIQEEIDLGIRPNRIALAGFSQGGAMSLFCGLQLPPEMKPAGLLVMSGYLPAVKKFKLTPGFEDVRILHTHGTDDQVVAHKWGEMTQTAVQNFGVRSYEFKSYPRLGHSVHMELLQYATQFLTSILPPAPEFCLAPKDPQTMSIKELKAAIRHAGLSSQALGLMEKSEFVRLLTDYRNTSK